ncbi:hypothetical protein GSI_11221 [Ganoderma sinense ZZ0214-1]|uniref:Uncharacterized protein n=1 Tax=Ganoderma sinense ZZ0214-1 TaxID=1077348 RepID=A0A2G8RYY4_9APHY|nr:hypothetical protein GSI_11221 [Ganoderma sinense ZZ0214-1]
MLDIIVGEESPDGKVLSDSDDSSMGELPMVIIGEVEVGSEDESSQELALPVVGEEDADGDPSWAVELPIMGEEEAASLISSPLSSPTMSCTEKTVQPAPIVPDFVHGMNTLRVEDDEDSSASDLELPVVGEADDAFAAAASSSEGSKDSDPEDAGIPPDAPNDGFDGRHPACSFIWRI